MSKFIFKFMMVRPQRAAAKKQKTSGATARCLAVAEAAPGAAEQALLAAENELTQFDDRAAMKLSEADSCIDSEMGVVEEIYCENFMCHRKLRVELSPHINFITGENGSGKSAIIAAIQICLGASARSTHRGKSIKNLIRHGHEGNALVRITLRNDAVGSDAFRPEQFGRKVMVERLIRRDGSAEYRLKDERGLLVSKLKTDLDAMLDHLNIQTENPCTILDQDNAKLFLKGNPQDKYKFFLQSTDLAKMRATYTKINDETRSIAESLKREVVKLATLKKAMEEVKQQWKEAQSVGKLEEEFEVLKKELAWSYVCEKEVAIVKKEAKTKRKQRDAENVAADYDESKEAVENLERKQKEKNDKLEEVSARMTENNQRKTEVKNRIREARRPLHNCKAEMKHLAQSKERANQRLARLQRDVQKKRENHEAMLHNRMQRNDEMRDRIEMKRREVADAEHEVNEAKDQAQARPRELDEVENRHETCLRQLREADSESGKIQHRINSLKSQKRDSLAVYGSKIPQLQQLIQQNQRRFTAPPIGPLGLHVKLPERFMHFAVAIEVALKGTLGSYLVVNGQDKHLLDDLKRQAHCPQNQANIIISQRTGRRYDRLRLAEGDLAAHAICNILEVSDDEVFNALVDVCSSESKLLFDDRQTAEQSVLSGSSGNFRMARYVSEVFLPSGDKFVVRSGNLAYIANKGNRRSSISCREVDAKLAKEEKKLCIQQSKLEQLSRYETRLHNEMNALRCLMQEDEVSIKQLARKRNRQLVERHSLEEELSDDLQLHALDTSVLEDEVRAVQDELNDFHHREQQLHEISSKANPDLERQLREFEQLRAMEKMIAAEMNEYQEGADATCKQLSEMKVQEMTCQREIESLRILVEKLQRELNSEKQGCDDQANKAQLLCSRPGDLRPQWYYTQRMKNIEGQLADADRRLDGLSLAKVKSEMEVRKSKFEEKNANFIKLRANLGRILAMLKQRQDNWVRFRDAISRGTSKKFDKYMANNNFTGKLKFRHDDQRLEIAVLQNEKGASRASQVTDMKELSGGERSYTQVSLLLALGESIECPFRVMDEFDVFMDSVNRDMNDPVARGCCQEGRQDAVYLRDPQRSQYPAIRSDGKSPKDGPTARPRYEVMRSVGEFVVLPYFGQKRFACIMDLSYSERSKYLQQATD